MNCNMNVSEMKYNTIQFIADEVCWLLYHKTDVGNKKCVSTRVRSLTPLAGYDLCQPLAVITVWLALKLQGTKILMSCLAPFQDWYIINTSNLLP